MPELDTNVQVRHVVRDNSIRVDTISVVETTVAASEPCARPALNSR